MKDKVLVDTSVWIEFFRKKDSLFSESLKLILKEDKAAYTGIVALELYQGAKGQREKEFLDRFLSAITYLVTEEKIFKKAGIMSNLLRTKGITVSTVDILLAQIAIYYEASIFSLDEHFVMISKYIPLKMFQP